MNDLRKVILLRKSELFQLKEFQFVVSLKFFRSMAFNVCHASIPVTSWFCYRSIYDAILTSK